MLAVAVLLAPAVAAGSAEPVEPPARSALLGQSEALLREQVGAGLRARKIEPRRARAPKIPGAIPAPVDSGSAAAVDPFAEQRQLVRSLDGDVRRVDYELFRDRVYRVRWQLAKRFERPIMAALVERLSVELGKPYYDQRIEGKFGSGRATLWRAGWRSGHRSLEVRQLTPMLGGPLFVTLSDQAAIRAIVSSGGTAAPEPDSIGPWWQEPLPAADPLTARERDALLAAFAGVLVQVGWQP